MEPQPRPALSLSFMAPQSRLAIRVLFKRDYDAFHPRAQRIVNWAMLLWDIVLVWLLLDLL